MYENSHGVKELMETMLQAIARLCTDRTVGLSRISQMRKTARYATDENAQYHTENTWFNTKVDASSMPRLCLSLAYVFAPAPSDITPGSSK